MSARTEGLKVLPILFLRRNDGSAVCARSVALSLGKEREFRADPGEPRNRIAELKRKKSFRKPSEWGYL